jgi:hypothetical protein
MKKLFTSMFIVLALLAMTAGTAFAQDATSITGTVQTVVIETNAATDETVVVVTLFDETAGTTQTVKISLETAATLGLVTTDPTTGESTVTENTVGTTVVIDSTTVIPEEDTTVPTEETQHPVGSALSDFFSSLLGVDYETIMTYHDEGVGFGVIAQALWLSKNLDGGTDTFEALLKAKQSGDYSAITLPDGSIPDNWGDIVRSHKKGENLGSVMSHRAKSEVEPTEVPTEIPTEVTTGTTTNMPGNGNGNSGSSNGTGNGHGNNNSNGGSNNGHGNGNGH